MVRRVPDRYYAIGITLLFGLAAAIGIVHHEMWRDEIQAWLLARDSVSLIDLARHLKYEGHPILWYVFLMALTRVTKSPAVMQAFHLLCAMATVYVFARYSPFNRLQKLLFAFGYFPLYEYGIISRNYGIGVFLLFVFAALFKKRSARFLWIAVVLSFAAHTNVIVLLIVLAVGFALLAEYLAGRRTKSSEQRTANWLFWGGFVLIALAVVASILQMIPPVDSGYVPEWTLALSVGRLTRVIDLVSRAFFPIPQVRFDFWIHVPLLETLASFRKVELPLSVAIVAWIALALLRKPIALIMYLLGTIGLLSFFYVKNLGAIRHHGFLFILFIVAVWVAHDCREVNWLKPLGRLSGLAEKSLGPILTILLLIHVIGGVIAVGLDYRYVFSNGEAAARFIGDAQMQDLPMVAYNDYATSTIVGYLGKDRAYYPQGQRWGSFVIWDTAREAPVTDEEIISSAIRLQTELRQDVLLVLDHPLNLDRPTQGPLTEVARFTGATISDEDFYLYRLSR